MADKIKVYLAGPMTNCSPQQQTAWRKRIRDRIQNSFHVLDPTASIRKGALAVSTDVQEADVVIANMWRESIGTFLGMIHAQGQGIPVILINQNFISPLILEGIADFTVRDEKSAVTKLEEVARTLRPQIAVIKRHADKEAKPSAFDMKKLQRSVKAACAQAGIDHAIFHTILSQRVCRAVLAKAKDGTISTESIKQCIFGEIAALAEDRTALVGGDFESIRELAMEMRTRWEDYENYLKSRQQEDRAELKLAYEEIEGMNGQIEELKLQATGAKLQLISSGYARPARSLEASATEDSPLVRILEEKLGQTRAICVSRLGRPTFKTAFERLGLPSVTFSRFFEEQVLDGQQSNLNLDLRTWLRARKVLYAWEDLRHVSDGRVKDDANLFHGRTPIDSIRRLLQI